ncbi:DNA polymerase IV [Pelistega europaea]|uniref:DNA polymerase IV n=1 Tax=Pelistega europaea TaxID=106147 RepID=A0A7Y4P729_9BURK|nr:DNA polymerase IV [Pelistega europaea]NOL50325.1 DNA polymerase IV [Pelistega europaea]
MSDSHSDNHQVRKIIHVDMDAFYASVELRENPHLRGLPVVVAWDSPRSVVCAASYEARKFGLHSAMSVARARQLCPQAIYIPPHFELYRAVSKQIRAIFERYTSLIEPLSLDEAYLDVTQNLQGIVSATEIANRIRAEIFEQTQLTASAGVAPNKFIAKIASDWNKPNGICVVPPHRMMEFLLPLPLEKIPGVGKVTLAKLHQLQMFTVADMAKHSLEELVYHFGKYGVRLYDLARGIDNRPVQVQQIAKQISTETTFDKDLLISEMAVVLHEVCEKLWRQLMRKKRFGRSLTVKLKTQQFRVITRSKTFDVVLESQEDIEGIAKQILHTVYKTMPAQRFRLLGVGVSMFEDEEEVQQLSLL